MNLLTLAPLLLAIASGPIAAGPRPNVLLVVLDDIGTDLLPWHPGALPDPAPTPTLDAMVAEGISFTNCWGAPHCSPVRACVLTGRLPHRTGIGGNVGQAQTYELLLSEILLPERIGARGYATALFGKWHLSLDGDDPCAQGFARFSGSKKNIKDYFNWNRIEDFGPSSPALSGPTTEYATTAMTDEAIAWIAAQGNAPYFAMVAYHVAHKPEHCPPTTMQASCVPGSPISRDWIKGMVESADTEIARLLAAVDRSKTTVIVIGDNGTPEEWTGLVGKSKGTVYRYGIEVPLVVWGAAVDQAGQGGLEFSGHVQAVDLYRSILQLLPGTGDVGLQTTLLDSIAFYNQGQFSTPRAWNFIERFQPLGPVGPYTERDRATEDGQGFKLIEDKTTGHRELYETLLDPLEETDLLADGISPFEQSVLDGLYLIQAGLGL